MLDRFLMRTQAYRSLHPIARQLFTEISYFYDGSNNGQIFVSVRQAAEWLGVTKTTAAKYIRQLEDRGFIICMQRGHFDWKAGTATTWRLTHFPTGQERASKEYMKWRADEKNTVPKNSRHGPKNYDRKSNATGKLGNNGTKNYDRFER